MKVRVEISVYGSRKYYFSLVKQFDKRFEYLDDSKSISNFLGLDIDTYNERLIKKVISHVHYDISECNKESEFYKDIIFEEHFDFKHNYIERFKKEFEKELILATLGGE